LEKGKGSVLHVATRWGSSHSLGRPRGNHRPKLWFDPFHDPTKGSISANTGTDGLTIDRFNMRQNTASTVPAAMQWDELRIGTAWGIVTPPAPAPWLTGLARLTNGAFQFSYSNTGLGYTVLSSSNLINWAAIGAATQVPAGLYRFTDASAANSPRRFYRLRCP